MMAMPPTTSSAARPVSQPLTPVLARLPDCPAAVTTWPACPWPAPPPGAPPTRTSGDVVVRTEELELPTAGEVLVEPDVVSEDDVEVVDPVEVVDDDEEVPVVDDPVDVVVSGVDDEEVVPVVDDPVDVVVSGVDDEVVDSVVVLEVVDHVVVVVSGQSSSGGTVSFSHSYQQVGSVVGWCGTPGGVQLPQSSNGQPANWSSHSEAPRATAVVPGASWEGSAELVAVPTTTSAVTIPASLRDFRTVPGFSVDIWQ
jgi:hypothetical protein